MPEAEAQAVRVVVGGLHPLLLLKAAAALVGLRPGTSAAEQSVEATAAVKAQAMPHGSAVLAGGRSDAVVPAASQASARQPAVPY